MKNSKKLSWRKPSFKWDNPKTLEPIVPLLPTTDVLILGLYDYGVPPHVAPAKWTKEIIAELRRSLGWRTRDNSFHDFSAWKSQGVQIIYQTEGIHTFNMLRYIRYEREEPMVVVLVSPWVVKNFKPCIDDAPDHIMTRYMAQAGASMKHSSLPTFYMSNIFVDIANHLGRNLDMWRI